MKPRYIEGTGAFILVEPSPCPAFVNDVWFTKNQADNLVQFLFNMLKKKEEVIMAYMIPYRFML